MNDWHRLRKALLEQGYTLRLTRKSHWQVINPQGKLVYVLPGSPSDWRSWKNGLAALKRNGFQL